MIDVLLIVFLTLLLAPAAIFTVGYGFRFRWWRSLEGVAMFSSALAWAALAGIFLLEFWRPMPNWLWVPVAVVALIGAYAKLAALIAVWPHRRRPTVSDQ